MSRRFVSVLIDTYNHERFIEQAVNSVLEQDFDRSEVEVLVVDDGSTDTTPEILRKYEPRLRILRKPNGGQASAFNHGIPECTGEIVAFLDGDDWWASNKLSTVADAFSQNPNIGVIGHSITEVLDDDVRRDELVRDSPRFRIDSVAAARVFTLRKSFLGTSRMAYRSKVLQRIGPVPKELVIEADEFLFTMGAVYSEVLLLREPLTFYRLQGQNLYQLSVNDLSKLSRKRKVLVALSGELRARFGLERVPQEIADIIVNAVELEADTLRVAMGEASRFETFRVELREYEFHHGHASTLRKFLKVLLLLPALVLPAQTYNAYKRGLTSNALYRKFRSWIFPFSAPRHVDRMGDWNHR